MKKENAEKYKAGRKYDSSDKDNGKALTQDDRCYEKHNEEDFGLSSSNP